MGQHVWQLFTITFAIWEAAQAFGVYIELAGAQTLASLDDTLFFFSLIPFGALPFLDPDSESDSFDKLHFLDFIQVCVLWLSILFLFSPQTPVAAPEIGPFIWSRNITFDALIAFTFLLRALWCRQPVLRNFFLRIALFLVLSGMADSYALDPKRTLQPVAGSI